MKIIVMLGALAMLAGCASKQAAAPNPLSTQLRPECYTVDLFDPHPVQPAADSVPADAAAFLGVWEQGAWGGYWCHDLHVVRAADDGTVEVLELHGPNLTAGQEPTVFKRVGRVRDGVLTFRSFKRATMRYRIEGKYLLAERRVGDGTFRAVLVRDGGTDIASAPGRRPAS